jgi:RecJ-like exonuclease
MSTDYGDSYGDWVDDDWGDEMDDPCTQCDGDGLVECNDILDGCEDPGGWHRCRACRGSGNRSDQRIF